MCMMPADIELVELLEALGAEEEAERASAIEPSVDEHSAAGSSAERASADNPAAGTLPTKEPSAGKTTEKAVHGKVKAGVVVLKCVEVLQPGNANLQLLEELALACLRRGLAVLHLSAWEFPQAVHVPVPTLNCKDLSAIALDDARGNVNGFHGTPSRNHLPGQIGRRAFCFSQATLHECNSSVSQIDGCAWWLLRV